MQDSHSQREKFFLGTEIHAISLKCELTKLSRRKSYSKKICLNEYHRRRLPGSGRLPRVWKLKWGRIRIPCGGQCSALLSRCRKEVDITLLNVGALSFRPPPVGQVQHLLREARTVGRQVGSSGEVAQEVSTLAPVGPLQRCWDRLRVLK